VKGFLLDTNVISEYSRAKAPDERVRKWVDAQDEKFLYLSVLALGEIRRGASLLSPGNKRNQLEAWLETELPLRFENRLLPINEIIAELWGTMSAEARLKGITLPVIDGLVAATAKYHELAVVTRNVRDFMVWGAPVVNPWVE
jgi:predicted nucleic acid-binding protein